MSGVRVSGRTGRRGGVEEMVRLEALSSSLTDSSGTNDCRVEAGGGGCGVTIAPVCRRWLMVDY